MEGYLIIYTKKDMIGHVRYEINSGYGYKEIRGLSVGGDFFDSKTIYEEGPEDSHYISVYNQNEYLASEKIPLTREEFVTALTYTSINDEEHQDYGLLSYNCNDFVTGVLSAAGKNGCVGDYLSEEQKDSFRLSGGSDFVKCRIPKKAGEGYELVKDIGNKAMDNARENVKKLACSSMVNVPSYMRERYPVSAYTRNCGRH